VDHGKPYANAKLTVACPSDASAGVVSRYGALWAAESGAQVEVVRYDADAPSPQQLPGDIWILPPARMPRYAAAGELLEVPGSYTGPSSPYGWEGILRDYKNKLLVWDQKIYALPLLGDSCLCFYRKDLLSDPRYQAKFLGRFGRPLAPPKTWEDFAAVAEFFATEAIGEPAASLPPLAERDEDLDREFFAIAAPLARRAAGPDEAKQPLPSEMFLFHYDLKTDNARIDSPAFVEALRLLKRLQKYRPPGTSAKPPEAFQKGQAALCLAAPSWIAHFERNPQLKGKFDFERLPASTVFFNYRSGERVDVAGGNVVPYLGSGGALGVVPRSCPFPEAAFALLAFLSDPQNGADIVIEPTWGGGVYRREQLDGRLGWHAFGLEPAQTSRLVESIREEAVHPRVASPVFCLRTPDEQEHQKILLEEIRATLLRGKEPRTALADVAKRWTELDDRTDRKTRRRNYRLSLGLVPD
jgi:ABC-type glycerol-3-phosphate transport system substrate-binding protein